MNFSAAAVDNSLLERMKQALAKRGPDDEGSWLQGGVGLGHRRLSVIDLSNHSHQPMQDKALGLVLVFNGAIYNYRELRADLLAQGYEFFSQGDSEVIIKAYHRWGEDCVVRLHGMFAFALFDEHDNSLFLARDRFGIKPLYYSANHDYFRFASNTQALLAAGGVDVSIDPAALHQLFTLHAVVPAPRTVLQGVRKLPPAHWMRVSAKGETRTQSYWSFSATRPQQALSEDEWLEAIHDSLRTAVRKRNDVADVPVGVLLSGGLDSSLLVALLAELKIDPIRTYSIGFEDIGDERGSEFEYSDQVVERYATLHHKIRIPNDEVLQRLPEAVDAMSEPMFGQDAIAFYLLAEQVSKDVKVVQSGQGADEVFGGYFWYPRMQADTQGEPIERFSRHYFDRDHAEMRRFLQADFTREDYSSDLIRQKLAAVQADSFLDAVLHLDVSTLIVDDPVKRVDNMTMAWGLEARVPFLDHHLVELAARCPIEIKLKEGGKYPLKAMARGLLPDAVIDRPKGYFPMPALKYVRGEFLDFMRDILNSSACRNRGLYSRSFIDLLLSAPEMHFTRIQGSKLWHAALLEYWLQRHLPMSS